MALRRSLLLLIALLLPTAAFATTKYVVKKGDNLYDLSRKYGVSVEDIKTLNKLDSINLGIGDELLIPDSKKDGNNKYVVKSGDTVSEIAEQFGIKTKDLKTANSLKNNNLQIGQTLYIPSNNNLANEVVSSDDESVEITEESTSVEVETVKDEVNIEVEASTKLYVVNKGDTLGHIAEKHNVKTIQLKEANNLSSHNLQIGQKLIIPDPQNSKTTQSISGSDVTVSNTYKVNKGDTIYDLSSKFNISKDNLREWNNLDNNNLSIDQNLYLTPNKHMISASKRAEMKILSKYTGEYKVKSGDTLGHIAVKHGVTVKDLKTANNLTNNNLSVGKLLKVPAQAEKENTVAKKTDTQPKETVRTSKYIVKAGDTLGAIANRHNTTVSKIKAASSLKNNNLKVGDVLLIPGTGVVKDQSGATYTVVKGDTLGQISGKFGVSIQDIREANSLNSNYIYAGKKLVIPGSAVIPTKTASKNTHSSQTVNTKYVVKSGDTLGSIAQNHGISATAIKNANNLKSNNIREGQIIVLPGAKDYRATASSSKPASNSKQNTSELQVKQDIVKTAMQYLGVRYKFGGYSLKTGIDCSGYVKKIFGKFNIELPRTARDMYWHAGTNIPKSQLQTGDLVFFTTYAKFPSHVGIYLGNGQFIHASSGARKVSITSLNKKYYQKRYIGAKRIPVTAVFEKEYSQR